MPNPIDVGTPWIKLFEPVIPPQHKSSLPEPPTIVLVTTTVPRKLEIPDRFPKIVLLWTVVSPNDVRMPLPPLPEIVLLVIVAVPRTLSIPSDPLPETVLLVIDIVPLPMEIPLCALPETVLVVTDATPFELSIPSPPLSETVVS